MRMAFGLVSLLIAVALIAWLSSTYMSKTSAPAQQAREQAEQLSGRGPDGKPASHSVTLDPQTRDGRLEALIVRDVVPGGALAQYYGLKKGDTIIRIGEFPVRDYPGGQDMAEAAVFEAAQRNYALVIMRDGKQITLSPSGGVPGLPGSVKIPTH